jgi:hypothetical protein
MKTQENAIATTRSERAPKWGGFRLGFAAMMLSLLALLAGHAQAEPNTANQYLQVTKNNFYLMKLNFQIGSQYAVARNANAARQYFTNANVNSIVMQNYATSLYLQNIDTLNRGLYRNASYQQQAVLYSDVLRAQIQVLSAKLSVLSQSPLSANARINAEVSIVQINATLTNLEQAMILAQR